MGARSSSWRHHAGLAPHDQIERAVLLELPRQGHVAAQPLVAVLALRHQAHVRLHDAHSRLGRRCHRGVHHRNANGPVDQRQHGDCQERTGHAPARGTLLEARDHELCEGQVRSHQHQRNSDRPAHLGELKQHWDLVHRGGVGPRKEQRKHQLAGSETQGEGHASGPAALLRAVREPAEQGDAARLVAAQDRHEQQAQRRGEAAEGLQHAEQPVEAEHRHGEARHPAEAGTTPRRLTAQGDDEGHQRHEAQRPHVDAGEGDEVEEAAEEREAVGGAAAKQGFRTQALDGLWLFLAHVPSTFCTLASRSLRAKGFAM